MGETGWGRDFYARCASKLKKVEEKLTNEQLEYLNELSSVVSLECWLSCQYSYAPCLLTAIRTIDSCDAYKLCTRSKNTVKQNVSQTKSLIKPPPPRTSWELLLDDYLKDPNFKTNLTSQLSPDNFSPHQQTFIPSYSSCIPCKTKSYIPPRRYQMTLDDIVYLISQVGRSDLYREMVQYVKAQQPPSTSSHSNNKSMNMNAYVTETSTESFFLNNDMIKKR
ncbi:unnamed protein product [Adineta steineri]|uniref:Uncharacterized protein n=1 Tax=Adineta steineri TaxID=433720 RepID=A0A814T6Z4_9BILA|nr:unnamed protein product [Adineta steineri]